MGHVCVDFMDVIMGDIPYINTVFEWDTFMLCVDSMDVIVGDYDIVLPFHSGSPQTDLLSPSLTRWRCIY